MPIPDAVRCACAIPVLSSPGILSIALLLGTLSRADAAPLVVPDEYPNVQSAIDAAESGDFIQIQPGVYLGEGNVNIDLQGKTLTIIGAGTDPDLQMFFLPSGGSVFNARSGEPPETTIAGQGVCGAARIRNSILWNNAPEQLHETASTLTTASYSVIQGGFPGINTIDVNDINFILFRLGDVCAQ